MKTLPTMHMHTSSEMHTTAPASQRSFWLFAGLLALFALIAFAYSLGLTNEFDFDDEHNFAGLTSVHDLHSALVYIFSGVAGPLGRPVSLATFALQARAWPDAASVMVSANILIHIINAGLLFLFAHGLARGHLPRVRTPGVFALGAAAVWAFSPLLASANLLAVQRMTTLSATFVLLGITSHLYLLRGTAHRPRLTSIAILFSMAIFTAFGSFAKENGALLPLLLLTLHATILPLRYPAIPKPYRYWPAIAFLPPVAALSLYALTQSFDAAYATRTFTLNERLMTEARVLLDYLRLLILPVRAGLGPYHDDFPLSTGLLQPASTLPAMLAMAALLFVALIYRRRWPLFAFSVLWFLTGHLLESTFIPLEIYFEHRNYIPAIGPFIALTYAFFVIAQPYARLARTIFAIYLILVFTVLVQTTTIWGDKRLAAELWAKEHPASERAVQNLAQIRSKNGDPFSGLKLLKSLQQQQPDNIGLAFQIAYIESQLQDSGDPIDKLISAQGQLLRTGRPNTMICQLLGESSSEPFSPFYGPDGHARMARLTDALLENPRIAQLGGAIAFCVHRAAAEVALANRDLPATMRHLEAAFDSYPILGIGLQMIAFPASAGLYDVAEQNLARVRQSIPSKPILREEWVNALDNAQRQLEEDKKQHPTPLP